MLYHYERQRLTPSFNFSIIPFYKGATNRMIEQLRIHYYSLKISSLPETYHTYLSKYNQFYSELNPHHQQTFRERLFICEKFVIFKPVEFSQVTEEMKVVILSALIQITFGLDKYILRRFKTIMVAPNTYKFGPYPALLGHVDYDRNHIVMSWPSVKTGFIVPDDAHNVAIHEIAHALQRENQERLFFADFFDTVIANEWHDKGLTELWKIRRHRQTYLSQYAGQNMLELFAVCMECFFEQPEAFKHHVPELYGLMTRLLKQDPLLANNPLLGK